MSNLSWICQVCGTCMSEAEMQGHADNCPEPRPAEPALPEEVEAALAHLVSTASRFNFVSTEARAKECEQKIRSRLTTLTAERDAARAALRAEAVRQARIEALEWAVKQAVMHDCDGTFGAAKLSTIHALCDDEERLKREVRIEALLWVCGQAMCADWRDLGERIKAELSRLRSSGEGRREGE